MGHEIYEIHFVQTDWWGTPGTPLEIEGLDALKEPWDLVRLLVDRWFIFNKTEG